jgi:Protein of unknown function (DUF1353)
MNESPVQTEQNTSFDRLKAWAIGLTGVLLVVPALINSGLDVYKAALKIPKTDAQKVNEEMFQKYFNKQPVIAAPIPITRDAAIVDAKFSIFDGGDIYVEFGKRTQWLPFPALDKKTTQIDFPSLISSAYAAIEQVGLAGEGDFQQRDTYSGSNIRRERVWGNGVVEILIIDPRTGIISNREVQQRSVTALPGGATNSANSWISSVRNNLGDTDSFYRFKDSYYAAQFSIAWKSDAKNNKLPQVKVPQGFVSDFSSIPKAFWILFPPDSSYIYTLIVHDYLYWHQPTTREVADLILREMLREVGASSSQAELLYSAAKVGGLSTWNNNAALKNAGERRVLAKFPAATNVTWADWKKQSNVFAKQE